MISYPALNPYFTGWINPLSYYPNPSNKDNLTAKNGEKEANDPFPLLRQYQKIQDVKEENLFFPVELRSGPIKAAYIKPPQDKKPQKELKESFNFDANFQSPQMTSVKNPIDKSPQKIFEDEIRHAEVKIEEVPSKDEFLKNLLEIKILPSDDSSEMSRFNPLVFFAIQRILNVAESLQNKEIEKEYELKQEELRIHDLITEEEWEEIESEADSFIPTPVVLEKEPLIEIKEKESAFSDAMKINKEHSLKEALAERRKSFEYEEEEDFESNEFWD